VALDFDGYAVGGLSVGERRDQMLPALDAVMAALPIDQPRYFMGLGDPRGIIEAAAPMQLFDQNPAHALATGQSHTRFVSLSPAATSQPLRVTLVWTDPPGNPIASVKLVNDLNLIVTNLDDTSLVYFGNDIASATTLTRPGFPPMGLPILIW